MTTPSQSNPESLSLAAAEQIEAIYVQFKQKWEDGQPLRLEEILKDVPAGLREALLQELLPLEVNYRRCRGEWPTAEDYLPLSPDQWELICSVLATASAPPAPAASRTERLKAAWPEVPGYQIEAELGKGGMGVVYRARHEELDRTVALKMIRGGADADAAELTRFRTEARAIAQLQHPHIVQIHEVGEHNGLPFFSLEFCPGGSLATRLTESVLPPRQAARLVEQVARGMQAAHAVGIVHRDLKPANVLLTQDGTPRVADFGLAKKLDEGGQTVTGVVMGTPSYMAPEQASGQSKDVGPAADVYALGAVLYECLTGRPPFKAASAWETVKQVLTAEPVPPRQLDRSLPRDLETICLKCLRKEPERRYATALALAVDLERFQAGLPVLARPVGRLERGWRWGRRNPVVASLVAAVTVLLVAVAGVSTYSAFSLQGALTRTQTAEREARADQRLARLREAEALIGQAHGIRTSHRSGQRFAALTALEKATAIGRELEQPPQWFDQVRHEVVNALALPDLYITHSFDGFPPGIQSVDMSDDFELYVRATKNGACSVRRVADDVEIAQFPELGEPAGVRFSSGRLLLRWGESSRRCWLWDLASATPGLRLKEEQVAGWWFGPGGRLNVLQYQNGSVGVFETDTGKPRYRLPANTSTGDVRPSFHPTEPIVAVCSFQSRLLQLRDLRTWAVLVSLTLPWRGSDECTWSPDGRTLAVSDGDSGLVQLYAFDPAAPGLSLERTLRDQAPGDGGTHLLFNPAGDRVVTRGWNAWVNLFDAHTGRLLFSTPSYAKDNLRFDLTGRRLSQTRLGMEGQKIGVWSVADGREFRALVHAGPGRRSFMPLLPAVHPGGHLAALGLTDGLALFDLETGRELAFVPNQQGGGIPCFDRAGNLFTSGPAGLFRWPVRPDPTWPARLTLGPPERLPFTGSTLSVDTSRDGGTIAQAKYNLGGWVLHPGVGQPRQVTTLGVRWLSVSPDGRWVACGHEVLRVNVFEFRVNVFEAATGRLAWQSPADNGSYCWFSRDGHWLLTDAAGGRAYAVGTWEPGPRLGPGTPWDLSPDGRVAVVGQRDGIYRLVERATGRELVRLEDPDQVYGSAIFTADGTRLVIAGDDGLRVWDLRRIRAELVKLDLDWDAPPYPDAASGAAAGTRPLEIRMEEAPPGAEDASAKPLKNPGFEANLDGWSLNVFGARPTVVADAQVRHEGKQSLRISAAEPSDTALGQEVLLQPGRRYRLSGWVRTRQLDPHGAAVFGTFQVMRPGGDSTLASGTNHQGNTDWTRVEIPFEAPLDGRVRIAVFFVGFGKGTGTAWFDDLTLEAIDATGKPLRVN